MPAKKSYRKRRTGRKKKYTRARLYRKPRGNMQVMNIKRTHVVNLIAPSAYPAFAQIPLSLSELTSSAELTELYAQYRICRLKIRFVPAWEMASGLSSTVSTMYNCLLYGTTKNRSGASIDFNSEGEFLESADGQFALPVTTPRKWYYTPNILSENYKTATTTGYSPKYKQWLLSGDPTVPHYGFAYGLIAFGTGLSGPTSGTNLGRFYITAYIQLKNVK